MSRPAPLPAPLRLRALLVVLAAVGGLALAPGARAEDAGEAAPASASAVSRLSAAEAEALRRRFPDWDAMEPAGRERLAQGILRLRGLSHEQRSRVLERARRLDRAGPVAAEAFAKNLAQWGRIAPDDRARVLEAEVVSRAVAVSVAQALPPAARGALGALEAGAWAGRGPSHATAGAIAAAWRKRAASALLASPPLDHEPRSGIPEARARAFRDLRERVRAAGGASAPEDLRSRYAVAVLEDRVGAAMDAARREAAAAPANEAARWAVLGRAVAAVDPGAFEAVVAEVAETAAKGEEAIELFRDRHAPGRGSVKQRAQWELVTQLEAKRLLLPPDLRAPAQTFQSALLRSLAVADERVRELEAENRPSARMRLLGDILRERGVPGGLRGLFPGAPGGGPGRGRDGPPRK